MVVGALAGECRMCCITLSRVASNRWVCDKEMARGGARRSVNTGSQQVAYGFQLSGRSRSNLEFL